MSGTSTPTAPVRPELSALAWLLGVYFRSAPAARMRSPVLMFPGAGVESARETVDAATPQSAAMSWMVAGRSAWSGRVDTELLSEQVSLGSVQRLTHLH